jgi:glycerol-3-phosphate dehydrogenase
LFPTCDAVGVGSNRASDAAIGKSKRLFFVTPWQDRSVIGTSHTKHEGMPDDIQNDVRNDVDAFLGEVNESLPRFQLSKSDVLYVHSGLTPAGDEVERAKRSTVIDHARTDGVRSLITVLGIKYTTAPTVAAKVVAMVRGLLHEQSGSAANDFSRPLPGGVGYRPQANQWQIEENAWPTDADWARRIYGANAPALLNMLPATSLSAADHVFRCRVLYGIDNEMVVRLRDAVFRATDLAQRGRLTADQLTWCADTMQTKFCWTAQRRQAEMSEVMQRVHLQVGAGAGVETT